MDPQALAEKEAKLVEQLSNLDSLIVAYSGGVDSSLLAYYARKTLEERAKIVIAISPSLSADELEAARTQAEQFNWNLIEINTDEVESSDYQRNDLMRCYFCKSTLFAELDKLASRLGIKHVAYGANKDDLSDFRPGHKAAREYSVLSPLQTAGLDKQEIRQLARNAGLTSWDRPQAACLSSRFQTFEPISVPLLTRVDKAEHFIRSLGFRQVRVRHHGDLARIELAAEELSRFASDQELMQNVSVELKSLGYAYVVLDMEGYRQGKANAFARQEGAAESSASPLIEDSNGF